MAQNSDNIAIVRPKTDGAAFIGGSSTKVPTDASTALGDGFASLGWISEDGITMTVDKETEDIKGFGGDTALTIQTDHSVEFKLTPLELNETVLEAMFGAANVDTTTTEGETAVKVNSTELEYVPWCFDMQGRNGQLLRVVVPKGKVTELGDFSFKTGEPVSSEFTIDTVPDTSGNKVYIYVK